jgi:hypothetical protein
MKKYSSYLWLITLSTFLFFSCSENETRLTEIETPAKTSTIVTYEEALAEVNALLDFFENGKSGQLKLLK